MGCGGRGVECRGGRCGEMRCGDVESFELARVCKCICQACMCVSVYLSMCVFCVCVRLHKIWLSGVCVCVCLSVCLSVCVCICVRLH